MTGVGGRSAPHAAPVPFGGSGLFLYARKNMFNNGAICGLARFLNRRLYEVITPTVAKSTALVGPTGQVLPTLACMVWSWAPAILRRKGGATAATTRDDWRVVAYLHGTGPDTRSQHGGRPSE